MDILTILIVDCAQLLAYATIMHRWAPIREQRSQSANDGPDHGD